MLGIHTELLYGQAGKLIQTLDSLEGSLKDLHLVFPQIIVVGEESSGKSTLLERIAMLEFFPRSSRSGGTTKMPVKLP